MQDIDQIDNTEVDFSDPLIQPNDVLRIDVSALNPDSAIPYNAQQVNGQQGNVNPQMLALTGYLVSNAYTIQFPILGELSVKNKTTEQLGRYIRQLLIDGEHLIEPTVNVRLVNAKVTILGEVKNPGTYNFTEQNITILQALGYAGDLTINGIREDVILMREVEGVRRITHIDLTSTDWVNGPNYFIKPNDVIVVNQNNPKVKTAGYIPNVSTLLAVFTVSLSLILLVTN
jgi:polysaccharide export outer membrane protein